MYSQLPSPLALKQELFDMKENGIYSLALKFEAKPYRVHIAILLDHS